MDEIFRRIKDQLLNLKKQIDADELFPADTPEATQLIHTNPYAFCVAVCLDRMARAEVIWSIPYGISREAGHFDPLKFYKMSLDDLSVLLNKLERKPFLIHAAPRTIQSITKIVVEECAGDAAKIWQGKKALEVKKTFRRVDGVGNGIANMAVLLIEKAYGIEFSDLDHAHMDIKPDVHTMRVLYRLGISPAIDEQDAIDAARALNPTYPGEMDGSLWILGRKWCEAKKPECNLCPLFVDCPKIGVDFIARG